MNYLLLLSIAILALVLYYVKTVKIESENFYYRYHQSEQIMDEEDEEDIFANLKEEDVVENVQLTPEERQQRQQDYQTYRKALQQQSEIEESLTSEPIFKMDITPVKQSCKGRCDCCFVNKDSSDRIDACNNYYKMGSKEHQECLRSNSKYAANACKDKYGTKDHWYSITKSCK